MDYFWEAQNILNGGGIQSEFWEDLYDYYGAHDLEPRREDVFNKLYFIDQNALKGKAENDAGKLMNAGTAYVKRLECSSCRRVFHKEYSLAIHEKKSHNSKQRREFTRMKIIIDASSSSKKARSSGSKKKSRSKYSSDEEESSDEEDEAESSGGESSDDEKEVKYADTTTDEDSDSDIELVASKGFKEKETKNPVTPQPTRAQRYQTRLSRQTAASTTADEPEPTKKRSPSPSNENISDDSGISESLKSPPKSRKISQTEIKKMISEKDTDEDIIEESPEKTKIEPGSRKAKSSINREIERIKREFNKTKIEAADIKKTEIDLQNEKKSRFDKIWSKMKDMEEEDEIQVIGDTFSNNDMETSKALECEEKKERKHDQDDGYDSDFEKMGGDLPLFSSDDPNNECILGL